VERPFYVFGYRRDGPSTHAEAARRGRHAGHRVLDQDRAIPADTVEVMRAARAIAVRVPLAALGRPERAFV